MQPKKIEPSSAKCTRLSFDAQVQLLRQSTDANATLTGFDIQAYTGAVVDRWWGKLAIAVEGIQAKQQMPIFFNHDNSKIVGYSTSSKADAAFSVQGVFSSATESANEVKALAAEGFPWQASMGVTPLAVLELGEHASITVNGQVLNGPAEVWLQSEVHEVSFVALGADSNTGITVFSEQQQRAVKPTTPLIQEQKMDLEQLKTEHPELVVALSAEIVAGLTQEQLSAAHPQLMQTLTAAGAQAERDRIAAVRAQALPGHEALIERMAFDGLSTGDEAARAVLAAERDLRTAAGERMKSERNPAAGGALHPEGNTNAMRREQFNALSVVEQGNLIKSGVQLVD